jgi:hypothetical protein
MLFCDFFADFGLSVGFRISAGLVLGMNFHPKWCSDRIRIFGSGFGFGCPDTPSDPNPIRCHLY